MTPFSVRELLRLSLDAVSALREGLLGSVRSASALGLLLFASVAIAAPPTRVASYGPNGTHWPDLIPTPFLYDAASLDITASACSWAAIGAALDSVDAAKANAGVRILVPNGTLTGTGASEGANASISNKGSSSWTRRVTICPLNGQGAVTISNATIRQVKGVCWAGFNYNDIMFHGCDRGAAAWGRSGTDASKADNWFGVFANTGHPVDKFEVVEIVDTFSATSGYDSSDFYTGGANLSNLRLDGCYWAPHYTNNAQSHTDTLQMASTNGGSLGPTTFRDCLYFASNNAAMQVDGTLTFTHCALVGGGVSRGRYPLTNGAVDTGYYGSLNGAGSASFTDCLIWNPTTGTTVSSVTNSKKDNTSSQAAGFGSAPSSGSWTLSGSMTLASEGVMAEPTNAYLASIWAVAGIDPSQTATPTFSPAGGNYSGAQSVTISTATIGATIRYTTDGTTPTATSGTVYSAPVTISTTSTLKAISYKTGLADSGVATAQFNIGDYLSASSAVTSWVNVPLGQTFTGGFIAEWDAVPSGDNVDVVMGLSNGNVNDWSQVAVTARFNTTGAVDARNGNVYMAGLPQMYNAGTKIHFRMVVKTLSPGTFDLFVRPSGGSEVQIAANYAFRTETGPVSSLNNLALNSPSGSVTVSNVTATSSSSPPQAPHGLSINAN